jgi:hypothetical protein
VALTETLHADGLRGVLFDIDGVPGSACDFVLSSLQIGKTRLPFCASLPKNSLFCTKGFIFMGLLGKAKPQPGWWVTCDTVADDRAINCRDEATWAAGAYPSLTESPRADLATLHHQRRKPQRLPVVVAGNLG